MRPSAKPGVDEIYLAAIEKPTAEARSAYLDQACAGDEELRQRVERLLLARPHLGRVLESQAPEFAPTVIPAPTESPGTVIGPFKLLQMIGEGGFGVVYMASRRSLFGAWSPSKSSSRAWIRLRSSPASSRSVRPWR
jgi:hypothetical protein